MKGLGFLYHQKNIEYADFRAQFELLYRGTIMFEMKFENRDFLKKQIQRYLIL